MAFYHDEPSASISKFGQISANFRRAFDNSAASKRAFGELLAIRWQARRVYKRTERLKISHGGSSVASLSESGELSARSWRFHLPLYKSTANYTESLQTSYASP